MRAAATRFRAAQVALVRWGAGRPPGTNWHPARWNSERMARRQDEIAWRDRRTSLRTPGCNAAHNWEVCACQRAALLRPLALRARRSSAGYPESRQWAGPEAH